MKHLHEKLYVMPQIAISDFAKFTEAGIRTIINNRPDDEEAGQLNHQDAISHAQANGIAYHYLPMANGQPMPSGLVSSFRTIIESNDGPILAHCRSGMRSTVIWAIGQIKNGEMSVDETIIAANSADIPLQKVRTMLENL